MIVTTRYSVYHIDEEAPGRFRMTKIRDLYPGGHPNVGVGDYFIGSSVEARVGKHLALHGISEHVHRSGRDCTNRDTPSLYTSTIQRIDP